MKLFGLTEILNTYKERHAMIEGMYDGFTGKPGVEPEVKKKYDGEAWYVKGGYMIGAVLSRVKRVPRNGC